MNKLRAVSVIENNSGDFVNSAIRFWRSVFGGGNGLKYVNFPNTFLARRTINNVVASVFTVFNFGVDFCSAQSSSSTKAGTVSVFFFRPRFGRTRKPDVNEKT